MSTPIMKGFNPFSLIEAIYDFSNQATFINVGLKKEFTTILSIYF